ncbi:MAG: ASKHA domain-containing protein [Chloroflexota bacterium]
MTSCNVEFEPVGRRGECEADESLLDCARRLGVGIVSLCGGEGTCQACKVRVVKGKVSEMTSRERDAFSSRERRAGWRLACQTYPTGDCQVHVPPESMPTTQRTQIEGLETAVTPEPAVAAYQLDLAPPTLTEPVADVDQLLETLREQHEIQATRVDIETVQRMSPLLRDWKWQCTAFLRHNEVVAVGPRSSQPMGLAIDLGSTKIASYLIDLGRGTTLAAKGIMNPQISYGEDIISRIMRVVRSPEEGATLQNTAVNALDELVDDLCAEVGTGREQVVDAVVVGNTAMHHLLLGLPVSQLVHSPFVPAVNQAIDVKARDVGLHIGPGAYVHLLPNIAGFVGADHVAMLLATKAWEADELTLALDIGTNTEVSLVDKGRVTTVSCASGPAFEGCHIKYGMRAAPGAIERVRLAGEDIQYQTVDEAAPVGICGSGVLDTLAQLYLGSVINERGRMSDKHPRIRSRRKQREFVLASRKDQEQASDIVFTQGDVRELQLAKAAIRTGIQALLEANGRTDKDISRVIIAGAFGSYIDVSSAVIIGMLPPVPVERFQQVGNAAGIGAKQALVSLASRQQAKEIASRVEYLELAGASRFNETFVAATYLGRFQIKDGNREPVNGH